MNSFVNVQIRVMAAQAQRQLAAINSQLGALSGGFGGAASGANNLGKSIDNLRLDVFGSRVQWIGRQLEYNFTVPILAAAAASYKFALDNEAAFTRVVKVYGDAAHGAAYYGQEINSLQKAFEALSSAYGIAQKDTIAIAADWAAAGASGLALAKSVKLTMETMILGELNAVDATKALIAIQAQYGYSIDNLVETISILNMVENQTGISMAGLIEGFARAAGVARSAGVDVRHLAAMLAALTPAAGSAAQAGNALKTIFSRLLSPTEETVDVLALMGIHTDDLAWKSANLVDRLAILSDKFEGLSDSQKGVVSSVVASRWQINKFEILMRELSSTTGYYQKALESTADAQANFTQMQRELNTVLASNPRRLQIIWTMMQNAAADIITPMIPLLMYLARTVQSLVQAFSDLDPGLQKVILVTLAFLALLGPVVRYVGAFTLAVAELIKFLWFLLAPLRAIGTFLAVGLVPMLRRVGVAIVAALTGPWGVAIAIVGILLYTFWDQVVGAMRAIIAAIKAGFNTLPAAIQNALIRVVTVIRAAVMRAYELMSYLNPWARHSPSLVDNVTTGVAEIIRQFSLLSNVGSIFSRAGSTLQAFGQALYNIKQLADAQQMSKMQSDVEQFAPELLGDFKTLSAVLASLRQELAGLQAAYPIEQAKAFSDAIFENQMHINEMQLRLMDLEDAVGPLDKLKSRIEAINGSMELLGGEKAALRDAGAGSDILSQYDDQINALEDQKEAIEEQLKPIQEVTDELEKLRREGERLNLEKSLALDPITRQMDELTDAIRTVEDALNSMGQAATAASQASGYMSPGAKNFKDAAGGNFPDVGGYDQIGREGGIGDQSALIDEFTKELAAQTANMFGAFNFLDPIKKGWNTAVTWLKTNIGPGLKAAGGAFSEAWGKIPNPFEGMDFSGAIKLLKSVGGTIITYFRSIWAVVGPPLKEIGRIVKDEFGKGFNTILPELKKFKDLWEPLVELFTKLWNIIKPLAIIIGAELVLNISIVINVIKNVLVPIFDFLINTIKSVIRIFRGLIEFLLGVFTGDWSLVWKGIKDVFGGVIDFVVGVFKGALGIIWGILKGWWEGVSSFFSMMWGMIGDKVKGAWDGIYSSVTGFISKIWNGFLGLIDNLKSLPGKITSAVKGAFDGLWTAFKGAVNLIIGAWNKLKFTIGGGTIFGYNIPTYTINTPDIPLLARGGTVTNGAMAIVGEGRRAYPEYVIPTDPAYRDRALGLFADLGNSLGLKDMFGRRGLMTLLASAKTGVATQPVQFFARGGIIGTKRTRRSGVTLVTEQNSVTYNFYGDLEFPNIKSGTDAEEFLRNLEALADGA